MDVVKVAAVAGRRIAPDSVQFGSAFETELRVQHTEPLDVITVPLRGERPPLGYRVPVVAAEAATLELRLLSYGERGSIGQRCNLAHHGGAFLYLIIDLPEPFPAGQRPLAPRPRPRSPRYTGGILGTPRLVAPCCWRRSHAASAGSPPSGRVLHGLVVVALEGWFLLPPHAVW